MVTMTVDEELSWIRANFETQEDYERALRGMVEASLPGMLTDALVDEEAPPPETASYRPLRRMIWAKIVSDGRTSTDSGVSLPRQDQQDTDLLVLDAGPECSLGAGARILALPGDQMLLSWQDREVLVDERKAVAWWLDVPGEETARNWAGLTQRQCPVPGICEHGWRPLNDWCALRIEYQTRTDEATGAAVEEQRGGVILATASLAGGDARGLLRGAELFHEFEALKQTDRYREAESQGPWLYPDGRWYNSWRVRTLSAEQNRILNNFTGALSRDDALALAQAIEKPEVRVQNLAGMTPETDRPYVCRGELVAVGPSARGDELEIGRTYHFRQERPVPRARGEAAEGQGETEAVPVLVAVEAGLVFIPAGDLICEEVPEKSWSTARDYIPPKDDRMHHRGVVLMASSEERRK